MKLFGDFEAVKFVEENLIFITHDRYLYYIYNSEYNYWKKYNNAGNDRITTENYPDVSKEELLAAMRGKFPTKETDFMRMVDSSQLCIGDMLNLLQEDHTGYLEDCSIYYAIHHFLLKSDVCYKSYEAVRNLLNQGSDNNTSCEKIYTEIKELSYDMIGRDIFKKEIEIVDGHDSSSYFWIMPVRVIDYTNTDNINSVVEMCSCEISIEELDISQYLTPFLYKHFDSQLEANAKRIAFWGMDDDDIVSPYVLSDFEWNLTHNFYTYEAIELILAEIKDTIDVLSSGHINEFTEKLAANRSNEDDTEIDMIIDFYNRFIYRMEYMIKIGKEKGYNLISFMGP